MGRYELTYPKDATNTVKRMSELGSYSLQTIHRIVNTSQILHVSFATPSEPFPVILPMIGQMGSFERPSASLGDPLDLYLHGYISSRLMYLGRGHSNDGEDKGIPLCVASSTCDGLILSMSAFSHSYTYRSAVLFGHATLVTDENEKLYAMELITNSVVPDRWRHTRLPPTKAELQSTGILKMKVSSGSAKVNEGQAHDNRQDMDNEDLRTSTWTGVLPIYQTMGSPVAGPYNSVDVPGYIAEFVEDFNEGNKRQASDSTKA
ncbi:hypothetical protein BKA59DRAFT_202646 [Fusarium tricinctum]|uniref:Flavin-nucleotide-binding protein n=1 Tax=Fusarium tricinctum TaxID=61284 RepID=A0A8K0RRQ5_9HYPO|nr:hypothetical protein BKA59DRAFT_202646 [Fusarium tricinctum]